MDILCFLKYSSHKYVITWVVQIIKPQLHKDTNEYDENYKKYKSNTKLD